MNSTFEYIISVLIIVLILAFTVLSIDSIVATQQQPLKAEQLDPVAERLLDKILLTRGYPYNWGTDITVSGNITFPGEETPLEDLGLAANSTNLYTLDTYKVMRLVKNVGSLENSLYIPPSYFGDLAGLRQNGTWDYGFRLLMKTALNITNTWIRNDSKIKDIPTAFNVTVKTHTGKLAPNALVTARYFCLFITGSGKDATFDYFYTTLQNVTNWNGNTILSLDTDSSFWDQIAQKKSG